MRRIILSIVLLVLSFVFIAITAFCQAFELELIDDPLPEAVRAPFVQFLRDLGVGDSQLLIEKVLPVLSDGYCSGVADCRWCRFA